MRRRLPGPLGRTYPVRPAAERLVLGVERRSAQVYGQAWVRAVQPVRSLLPAQIARFARADLRQAQEALRTGGSGASPDPHRSSGGSNTGGRGRPRPTPPVLQRNC